MPKEIIPASEFPDPLDKSPVELMEFFRTISDSFEAQILLVRALFRHDTQTLAVVLSSVLNHDLAQNGDGSGKILAPETLEFIRNAFRAEDKHGQVTDRVRTEVTDTISQ